VKGYNYVRKFIKKRLLKDLNEIEKSNYPYCKESFSNGYANGYVKGFLYIF
jgi:hypothetical protein